MTLYSVRSSLQSAASGTVPPQGRASTAYRVLAVDDTAVSDSSALKNYLKDKGIGDTVNLQVERDGKVLTLAVTLGSSAQ